VLGLQATITDVLVRAQMFDGSHSTTLIRPSRPRLRLGMHGTTWVFAKNASVIGLTASILLRVSS